MTRRGRRLLIPALLAALLVPLGRADHAIAFSRKVQLACKSDYKKLCPHYKTGSPQLRACMEAKAGEISSQCIATLMDEGVVERRRASR